MRHHHLVNGEKVRLQEMTKAVFGVRIDGLAGLYCYFLALAHSWLRAGAVAGWLIPGEFMTVNYGRAVKYYLLHKVTSRPSPAVICAASARPGTARRIAPPAPFICTYIGRSDSKRGKPFRFLLNHSQATAANVYLMLYPKPVLARALAADPTLARSSCQMLDAIQIEALLDEGRVYGGGLHKLEPNELANVKAEGIQALLCEGAPEPFVQHTLFDVVA